MESEGSKQKLTFISECISTAGRFEKPISRNKISNFASQNSSKVQKNNSKEAILKTERDIFGRLLAINLEKKINVEYCLTFPLAPIPPAFFSCTGDMLKTQICIVQGIEISSPNDSTDTDSYTLLDPPCHNLLAK